MPDPHPPSIATRRKHAVQFDQVLTNRLRTLLEFYTCADIARATGYHEETVRRYLSKGSIPAHFVVVVVQACLMSPSQLLGSFKPLRFEKVAYPTRRSPRTRPPEATTRPSIRRSRRDDRAADPLADCFAPHTPTEPITPVVFPRKRAKQPA